MTAISALLGPTNTGKTHRAIERMLEHRTGMMGLPLRLLAREVYDRVSARCGESQVALVTGEEKRIPARPKYWVCTVEAMPMSTEVDFLAVDEVQLSAHPERGHVFTERLLAARGVEETWFMGSDAMREILSELVPTAAVVKSPRLSTLRGSGSSSLSTLPRRSAVVAFSLTRVFEIAERIRRKRGGAAVVVGALSPRARNAQVALYQSGQVDFLVATDAIGMGLNLDIDHVAFADARKFDGRVARDLDPAELAQIAGRAGRYVRDGTFGTLLPLPELSPTLTRAIEQHRFSAVRALMWRNADLDFDSMDGLLASLARPSTARRLKRVDGALDQSVLAALGERPEVRRLARGEPMVRLLWSACSIPDYRQLLFEEHVGLVARVFEQLATRGKLGHAEISAELERIERETDDLETLMDRIASIRTWNFVAHQAGWVERPESLRERARKLEDDLSDALHSALVTRFVDDTKKRTAPARRAPRGRDVRAEEPPVVVDSPFARLAQLRNALPDAPQAEDRRGDEWIERAIDAPHAALQIEEGGWVRFDGQRIGKLVGGRTLVLPEAVVTLDTDAGYKLRLGRRLVAWSRDLVHGIVGAVTDLDELEPSGRGLVHLLSTGLGTVLACDAAEQLSMLSALDRERLREADVVLGTEVVYLAPALRLPALKQRVALAQAFLGLAGGTNARIRFPVDGPRSVPVSRAVPIEIYTAMGYPVVDRRAVRADVLERSARRKVAAATTE